MRQEIGGAMVILISQSIDTANRRPPENMQKAFNIQTCYRCFPKTARNSNIISKCQEK
jgi:hypothetical protein